MTSRPGLGAPSAGNRWLLVALTTLAACSSNGGKETVRTSATEILQHHAENAFAVFVDEANTAALQSFLDQSQNARSRDELIVAWRSVPMLNSEAPDLLQVSIFDRASEEPGWPTEAVSETVFVETTRSATG